jgi:hypothetical protein
MCLFYLLRPLTPSDQARVSSWDRAPVSLDWTIDRDDAAPTLSLHGCDMVREWDRPSGWKLSKVHRSSLHADLSTLFRALTGKLELTAVGSSDAVDQQVHLARSDVLAAVLSNRIANRTVYSVPSEPPGDVAAH